MDERDKACKEDESFWRSALYGQRRIYGKLDTVRGILEEMLRPPTNWYHRIKTLEYKELERFTFSTEYYKKCFLQIGQSGYCKHKTHNFALIWKSQTN